MTRGPNLTVLGIETSCDETAAAIVRLDASGARAVLADVTLSQIDDHRPFGGVVPEIAARAHVAHLDRLVAQAMATAGLGFSDLDAIAATAGPGLIGGVIVGLTTAKALALGAGKPLVAVNHLEGHALSARLTESADFPFLLLLVSGGHCQLLEVSGIGAYRRLGTTIDDAVGEAFDKVAKLLGLAYPGGPEIERLARSGDPARFDLPRPLAGRPGLDFSFSGLKTAVRQIVETRTLDDQGRADLAAGFQARVASSLAEKTARAQTAMIERLGLGPSDRRLVVAGGVAANGAIRAALARGAEDQGFRLIVPPIKWCTDNGAMIAWAGIERLRLGLTDPLDTPARARWPLDASAAPVAHNGAATRAARRAGPAPPNAVPPGDRVAR